MYERFTDRCRRAFALANQEAIRHKHEYIGSGPILLGIVKEGNCTAVTVLKKLFDDLSKVQDEVERLLTSGNEAVDREGGTQTNIAKNILASAIEEARAIDHNYVGSEHILLGFLHEPNCVAMQSLTNLGLSAGQLRKEVYDLLRKPDSNQPD